MDVGTVEQMVTSLGFPIFVCIATGVFLYKMWTRANDQNEKREEKYTTMMMESYAVSKELLATNKELSETNKQLVDGFSNALAEMQGDIKDIKDVVLVSK